MFGLFGPKATKETLFEAVEQNDVSAVRTILKKSPQLADQSNEKGETSLISISRKGNLEMAKALIENGADPNRKDESGWAPLHICAAWDHVELAEMLIKKGAKIDVRTREGETPLHIAVFKGNRVIVKILLQYGSDINARKKDLSTPIHLSVQKDDINIARLLMVKGANVQAKDNDGRTPLALAYHLNHHQMVEFLGYTKDTMKGPYGTTTETPPVIQRGTMGTETAAQTAPPAIPRPDSIHGGPGIGAPPIRKAIPKPSVKSSAPPLGSSLPSSTPIKPTVVRPQRAQIDRAAPAPVTESPVPPQDENPPFYETENQNPAETEMAEAAPQYIPSIDITGVELAEEAELDEWLTDAIHQEPVIEDHHLEINIPDIVHPDETIEIAGPEASQDVADWIHQELSLDYEENPMMEKYSDSDVHEETEGEAWDEEIPLDSEDSWFEDSMNPEESLETVVDEDNDLWQEYTGLGYELIEKNEAEKALSNFNLALELQPRNPQRYADRAVAYQKMGKISEALGDLNRAIELEPQEAGYFLSRARIHHRMGNDHWAAQDCEMVLELSPFSDISGEAQKIIDELQLKGSTKA